MRVLLLTPPMTQLNTPYPATAYLVGCLRKHRPDVEVRQADAALMLFLRLFSRAGLTRVLETLSRSSSPPEASQAGEPRTGKRRVRPGGSRTPRPTRHPYPSVAASSPGAFLPDDRRAEPAASVVAFLTGFLAEGPRYLTTIEAAVRFLQGGDPSLAMRIVGREFLPEGPRFAVLDDPDLLEWAFGALGTQDQAKYLASLFIDDVADVFREAIDPRFELSRYGERLAASAASFDGLRAALDGPPTLVDDTLDTIARELAREHQPDLVGLTVPFPGNVYGAFRMARAIRRELPAVRIAMGGGYVNTELRELSDPRVFDEVDFITLDDGEQPLLSLLAHLEDASAPLFRTFTRSSDRVVWKTSPGTIDVPFRDAGTPSYVGLPLADYVSIVEMLNPMHRLWSDGRWNKLTVAHGCYWKKCTFCDLSLDYIARYEGAPADALVDRMEALMRETGQGGFHFVDEAAPPAALRALAERLLARGVVVTWWGNIRFEKTFTPELARLLARSGCVAISGGLEVASDRLLALMKKGVTVEQVARVTRAFTDAGVMVHAYLMYGFPTETQQETIDALERVRQLFAAGCLQSAFWHRFAATAHSPIGLSPTRYGIRLLPEPVGPSTWRFARNDLAFVDPVGCDHDALAPGLRKAVYNYMHGLGIDADVRQWFASDARARRRLPATGVRRDLIARALEA